MLSSIEYVDVQRIKAFHAFARSLHLSPSTGDDDGGDGIGAGAAAIVRWLSVTQFSLHVLYLCFRFCLYNTFISPYHRLAGTSASRAEMFNFVRFVRMGTCAKAKISTSTGNNTQNIIPSIWHSSYSSECVCVMGEQTVNTMHCSHI